MIYIRNDSNTLLIVIYLLLVHFITVIFFLLHLLLLSVLVFVKILVLILVNWSRCLRSHRHFVIAIIIIVASRIHLLIIFLDVYLGRAIHRSFASKNSSIQTVALKNRYNFLSYAWILIIKKCISFRLISLVIFN